MHAQTHTHTQIHRSFSFFAGRLNGNRSKREDKAAAESDVASIILIAFALPRHFAPGSGAFEKCNNANAFCLQF